MNPSEYVVFSFDALQEWFVTVYTNVGSVFNVAIWTFIIVLGFFRILDIVRSYGQ